MVFCFSPFLLVIVHLPMVSLCVSVCVCAPLPFRPAIQALLTAYSIENYEFLLLLSIVICSCCYCCWCFFLGLRFASASEQSLKLRIPFANEHQHRDLQSRPCIPSIVESFHSGRISVFAVFFSRLCYCCPIVSSGQLQAWLFPHNPQICARFQQHSVLNLNAPYTGRQFRSCVCVCMGSINYGSNGKKKNRAKTTVIMENNRKSWLQLRHKPRSNSVRSQQQKQQQQWYANGRKLWSRSSTTDSS